MIWEWIRFGVCALLALAGLFVLVSATLGIFRFRYALSRIHAAALVDTIGVLLLLCSLVLAQGMTMASLKLAAVIVLLWCTSPVSSHLIGRLEIVVNDHLSSHMSVDDDRIVLQEREGD